MTEIPWASEQEARERFHTETLPASSAFCECGARNDDSHSDTCMGILRPGYRRVNGEILYSAAWLNDPREV